MKKLTILCIAFMITVSTHAQDNIPSTVKVSSATYGCRVNDWTVSYTISPEKVRELTAATIEKARKKATIIAGTQNRKVGRILKIVDHEWDRAITLSAVPTFVEEGEYPYSVTATFELL